MIQSLLTFKTRIDGIQTMAFEGNEAIANAIKESFENFVNSRQDKPAELIAKFIDGLLKASKRDEAEVERTLDQCLVLFRYVQGRRALLPSCPTDADPRFFRQRCVRSFLQERFGETVAAK